MNNFNKRKIVKKSVYWSNHGKHANSPVKAFLLLQERKKKNNKKKQPFFVSVKELFSKSRLQKS